MSEVNISALADPSAKRALDWQTNEDYWTRVFPYVYSKPKFDMDGALIPLLDPNGTETWLDIGSLDSSFDRLLQAHHIEGELISDEPNAVGDKVQPALQPDELRTCLGYTAFNSTTAPVILRLVHPETAGLKRNSADDPISKLSDYVVSTPIKPIKADARDLHLINSKSVGIATVKSVMSLIPAQDRPLVYGEILRILTEDGKVAFVTASWGNRPHKRALQLLTAYHLGATASPPMCAEYTTRTARAELSDIFKHVSIFTYHGTIDINTPAKIWAVLRSVGSLWNQFDPIPDETELETVLKTKIWDHIVKIIEKKGRYVEPVERAAAIVSNHELDERRMKRQAELLHMEYERVA